MGHHVKGQRAAIAIPYRLRVGVTGHRHLPDAEGLTARVTVALERVCRLVPASATTPVYLSVVSSLAEGADRLVAHAVLRDPDNLLEVILPLPDDDYKADFATAESRRAFDALLMRADDVMIVAPAATREEAYLHAGQEMAERSDVLIALWDGQPPHGPGGTGAIVGFARDRGISLIWIETAPPFHIHEEIHGDRLVTEYRELDAYNRGRADEGEVARGIEEWNTALLSAAKTAGLPAELLHPLCDWIVPIFAGADARARRYQARFLALGAAIFLLAAAATVTVTFQRQFFPGQPLITLIEILFIALNWAIVYAGRDRGHLQRRWIAYRALAERLRSRLFLALLEDVDRGGLHPTLVTGYQPPEDWVNRAFEEVWRRRPSPAATVAVDTLKRFLIQAWFQDQIAFFQSRGRTQRWRDRQLNRLVNLAWVLTILVVLFHAFSIESTASMSSLLIILAIALPAFAAALRAIGDQREYPRNAKRYEQIARLMATVTRRMEVAVTPADVRAIALQAEAMVLEENRDWVFIVSFRDLYIEKG